MAEWTKPPSSLDEALKRKADAAAAMAEIQAQLARRNMTDGSGRRISYREYHRWRDRAIELMQMHQQELIRLKQYIREQHAAADAQKVQAQNIDPNDTKSLLWGAYRLLKELAGEIEVAPAEQALMDTIQRHLRD